MAFDPSTASPIGGFDPSSAAPVEEDGFLSNIGGLIKSGAKSAMTAAKLSGDVATGDIDKEAAGQIAEELNREKPAPAELEQAKGAFKEAGEDWKAADQKEGLQSFLGKAEGISEMIYAVGHEAVTNPKGLAYLTAEQAANMAPSIAGMIVGAKAGAAAGGLAGSAVAPGPGTAVGAGVGTVVGGVGGAFAGEWPMEAGSELIGLVGEEVARRGLKSDEQGVAQVLADQKFMQDAIGKVRTKATVTSGIDAAFTLGAGKLASAPAKAALRDRISRGAGAVALDVAGGGASEAGGELAAYGKVDLENVGAEMLGELGGSAVEVPAAAYSLRNEDKPQPTDILNAPTLDAAIQAAEAVAARDTSDAAAKFVSDSIPADELLAEPPMAQAAEPPIAAAPAEQPAPPILGQANAIPSATQPVQQSDLGGSVPAGDVVRPVAEPGQSPAATAAGTGVVGGELAAGTPERAGDAAGADARVPVESGGQAVGPSNTLAKESSWVIRNKETGEVVMETFDKAKVNALNTAKYEAVPILEYLQGLNKPTAPANVETSKEPAVISAKPAETAQSDQLMAESKPVFGTNSAGKITLRGVPMEKIQAVRDKLGMKGVIIGKDSAVFPKGTDLKTLQAAFDVAPAPSIPKPKKTAAASTDLLGRIKQLGGINSKYASDVTGEQKPKGAWKFAFGKNGLGLDDLASQLAAEGFTIDLADPTDNGGVNQLAEMIRRHIGGERAFKAQTQEAQAEAMAKDHGRQGDERRAAELGIKDAHKLADGELRDAIYAAEDAIIVQQRLENEAEAEAIAAFSDAAMEEEGINEIASTPEAVAEWLGVEYEQGSTEAGVQQAVSAGKEEGSGTDGGTAGKAEETGFLQSYTNAEVLKREAAAAKAAEEAAREPAAKPVTADQADMFQTQESLFSSNREQPESSTAQAGNVKPADAKFWEENQKRIDKLEAEIAANPNSIAYDSDLAKSKQDGFTVRFGGRKYPIDSLQDASDKWVAFRDETGGGGSEIGNGVPVFNKEGKQVAHISYNGRIWRGVDKISGYPDDAIAAKSTAKAKKLEVLKAQAQGKISGDQGAALKELADAGEHAAVDEVLKPSKPNVEAIDTSAKPVEKSAENVQKEIDQTGGVRFSKGKKDSAPTLIIQHNLSEQNLLHADRMGGIPIPSLAITQAEHPLEGFGDITLVGGIDMADPKGYAATKVFGADIYSPRYPNVSYQFTANMQKTAEGRFKDAIAATNSSLPWDDMEGNGARELERSAPVMWQFLKENGIEPKIVRTTPDEIPKALQPFAKDGFDYFDATKDPEFVDAVYQSKVDDLVAKGYGTLEESIAQAEQWRDNAKDRGVDYFVQEAGRNIERYLRDKRSAGKIDREKTRYALERQIDDAGLRNEMERYATSVFNDIGANERIFQGYTNSGNRKYIPHTLDNVIKLLKKELRGGEGFNYGVGSIRSKYTPQFKSIEQIRKAKDRLMTSETFKNVKEEIDTDFTNLADEFRSYHPIGSEFGFLDTMSSTLYDAATMGLPRAFRENGFEDIPPEKLKDAAEFLDKLRTLPTEYFEAKILRAVDLSEFKGAVVPDNIDQKALDVLKKRGITNVLKYNKSDVKDRAAKIKQLAEQADLLFSQSQSTARNPYTITTLRSAINEAMGKGFAELLEATDKFKIISSEQVADYLGGAEKFSKASQTDTPAFKAWFGDSKVVDADGKPLVVYHGGAQAITEFEPKRAGSVQTSDWGDGVYFTPSKFQASSYAEDAALKADSEDARLWAEYEAAAEALGTTVMGAGIDLGIDSKEYESLKKYDAAWRKNREEVRRRDTSAGVYASYLSLKNPLEYTYAGVTDPFLANRAKEQGHDGIIIRREDGSIDEIVVFRPEQIKSATGNIGTFDPKNPDIRYSKDGRILAFVTGGKTYFVADNIGSDDSVKGLLHHELGVHALQLGRTDEEFQKILGRIETLRKMGDKRVKAAFARVPNDTPAHLVAEEAAGYLAESNPDMPIIQKLIARFRALLRSIGRALPVMQRAKWFQWAADLSVDDILLMAQQATKRAPQDLAGAEDRGVFKADRQSMFYSQLRKAMRDAPDRVFSTGKATALWLQANTAKLGIKKDELFWTGITDWLNTQGKVSKVDVLAYLDGNGVQVQNVMLGDSTTEKQPVSFDEAQRLLREDGDKWDITNQYGGRIRADRVDMMSEDQQYFVRPAEGKTKFAPYQLPGGENYRELLLTLPVKELTRSEVAKNLFGKDYDQLDSVQRADVRDTIDQNPPPAKFKSSHFPDQTNILAHIRFNERTDAEGKRVLFLEEIQSDFGQSYKKQRDAIGKAVDADFIGIIERMKKAGVLEVNCD